MRSGYFKETIAEQINLTDSAVVRVWLALLIVVLIVAPFYLNPFYLSLLTIMAITAIGALGLNILTGWTGLISLGHVGFELIAEQGNRRHVQAAITRRLYDPLDIVGCLDMAADVDLDRIESGSPGEVEDFLGRTIVEGRRVEADFHGVGL